VIVLEVGVQDQTVRYWASLAPLPYTIQSEVSRKPCWSYSQLLPLWLFSPGSDPVGGKAPL